jgi:hypothetical protein
MLKKIFAIIGVYLLTNFNVAANSVSEVNFSDTLNTSNKSQFTLMPESHIVPLFTADSRAHRLSVCNVIGTGEFVASMGGIFPVLGFKAFNKTCQFSGASTLYTTLVRSIHGGSLINTDFFVDLFLDIKLNEKIALRGSTGHTSEHLSDDAINKYHTINYVRDYFELFGIYQLPKQNGIIYGGIIFNHNIKTTNDSQAFDLSGRPTFQLGFEYTPLKIGKQANLYFAADVKFKAEVDLGSTQNLQAGIKWTNEYKRAIRLAVNYSWGYDERGQFYTQKREYVYAGLYLDF